MKIAIINCVNKKYNKAMAAKDLYHGIAWDAKVAFVESKYDKWYILSAKYGLISPNDIIEPYNISFKKDKRFLNHHDTTELVNIKEWSKQVVEQVNNLDGCIHFHLGDDYFKPFDKLNYYRVKQLPNHCLTAQRYKQSLHIDNLEEALDNIIKPIPKNPEEDVWWYHPIYEPFFGKSYELWKLYYKETKLNQLDLKKVNWDRIKQHNGFTKDKSLLKTLYIHPKSGMYRINKKYER